MISRRALLKGLVGAGFLTGAPWIWTPWKSTVQAAYIRKAFIGAEGYGARTSGWRDPNAQILFVTNLNDNGPGSFRQAFQGSTGPRYIIFQVGGYIPSGSSFLSNEQHGGARVYVAGQTAPGDGVGFKGADTSGQNRSGLFIRNGETCVRYIRSRNNDATGTNSWAFGIWNADTTDFMTNVIVDHCSFSYASDDNIATTPADYLTIQYCLLHEGLPGHAILVDVMGPGQQYTFHHNVIMHFCQRHPLFVGGNGEFHNNLIYNWGGLGVGTGGDFDCYYGYTSTYDTINNYYKWGPTSVCGNQAGNDDPANGFEIQYGSLSGGGTLFLSGNKALLPNTPHVATPNTYTDVRARTHISPTIILVGARQLTPPVPVTIDDISTRTLADAWAASLLTKCGCIRPRRDAVDTLACASYGNFTGNSSCHIEADTLYALAHGGDAYGTLASGTPLHQSPSGMTASFRARFGLNNTVADALSTSISASRGLGEDFQNLEWNLMEVAGDVNLGSGADTTPPAAPTGVQIR